MAEDIVQTTPADSGLDLQGQQALNKLTRRLLLIFVVPLIVIVILAGYSFYLAMRVKRLEDQTTHLAVLQEWNVTERVYSANRNYEWAVHKYGELSNKYPDSQILTRLAGLYLGSTAFQENPPGDHFEQVLQILEKAKSSNKENWEIYSILFSLYYNQGKEKEALQAAEDALQLNAFDVQAYNNAAWLYAHTHDKTIQNLEKSKEYALKAVQYTRKQNSQYLDTLAETQFLLGDVGSAMDYIEMAISLEQGGLKKLEEKREKFKRAVEEK
jgi:tetratricopeptide (TPR) repeat protein